MELNLENKAKFFNQYRGQMVFKLMGLLHTYRYPSERLEKYDYVELKPLSSITDEDAINVEFEGGSSHFIKVLESYGHEFNDLILKHNQIDYLRSKGYALPWMGISVEQMVSAGWIKLIEE